MDWTRLSVAWKLLLNKERRNKNENLWRFRFEKIRESCELDFAHYTYGKGQCSCCYGPLDMPKRYWRNGKKPIRVYFSGNEKEGGAFHYELDGQKVDTKSITYILFKNACNGSGRIKNKDQVIENHTCITYHFRDTEQKEQFCKELAEQLGNDYVVAVPQKDSFCIIIYTADEFKHQEIKKDYYTLNSK